LDFIEACRKFISLDSSPSTGNWELVQYAAELCRELGLHVDIQQEAVNGILQSNIIARPSAEIPPEEFMLQTHLDTADPGPFALWTKNGANPFNASIYQDAIYGLGAADVKLDFLCKLEAIKSLMGRPMKLPFVLVGTFGEETGMQGAVKLIRKKKISVKRALIGEPSSMRLIHAGKGFGTVEIEIPFSEEEIDYKEKHDLSESSSSQSKVFVGKAAHSSVPEMGENAIRKMFDYFTKLPAGIMLMEMQGGVSYNTVPANAVLEVDVVGGIQDAIGKKLEKILKVVLQIEEDFKNFPDPSFDPPHPTLNIGMVRTYPDHIKLSGCCRLPPTVTNEHFESWMQLLRETSESVGGSFRVTEYKQSFKTSPDSELFRICRSEMQAKGLETTPTTQAVTNEANVFSRFGIECVVIGPGQGVGNSHSPNEYVKISDLNQAIEFYRSVVEKVCL
jgi:acetylornithine deacetylase/succinyl-diaminopimelate desuccinylase-like protein